MEKITGSRGETKEKMTKELHNNYVRSGEGTIYPDSSIPHQLEECTKCIHFITTHCICGKSEQNWVHQVAERRQSNDDIKL